MIEAGSIHARISQADGMVRFDTDPEAYRLNLIKFPVGINFNSPIQLS